MDDLEVDQYFHMISSRVGSIAKIVDVSEEDLITIVEMNEDGFSDWEGLLIELLNIVDFERPASQQEVDELKEKHLIHVNTF